MCVGLDTDMKKIPAGITMYDFNRAVIDATAQYAVAYKPNLAFYEAEGAEGWKALERTVEYLRLNYPDIFIIADAKRGDIGNTAKMYAKALFGNLDFDAVTLAPYMGTDSVRPFLEYKGKWAIVLAVTSNASAAEFQYQDCGGEPLYHKVVKEMLGISGPDNMMFVTGATHAAELAEVRKLAPENFLLVPGPGRLRRGSDTLRFQQQRRPVDQCFAFRALCREQDQRFRVCCSRCRKIPCAADGHIGPPGAHHSCLRTIEEGGRSGPPSLFLQSQPSCRPKTARCSGN